MFEFFNIPYVGCDVALRLSLLTKFSPRSITKSNDIPTTKFIISISAIGKKKKKKLFLTSKKKPWLSLIWLSHPNSIFHWYFKAKDDKELEFGYRSSFSLWRKSVS